MGETIREDLPTTDFARRISQSTPIEPSESDVTNSEVLKGRLEGREGRPPYTMDDYHKSSERLKTARRIVAKFYVRSQLEQSKKQGTGIARPEWHDKIPKYGTEEEEQSWQDYTESQARKIRGAKAKKNYLDGAPYVREAYTTNSKIINRLDRMEISRTRPNWEDHFPKDVSKAEMDRWIEYVESTFAGRENLNLRRALYNLQRLQAKHQEIKNEPSLQAEIDQYEAGRHQREGERRETFERVAAYRNLERKMQSSIAELKAIAVSSDDIGEVEWQGGDDRLELVSELGEIQIKLESLLKTQADIQELERRRNLDSKREFDGGVLMTQQMIAAETRCIDQLLGGQPVLLIGETGGAKTALARHMAAEVLRLRGKRDHTTELVSGYVEISAQELMGSKDIAGNAEKIESFFTSGVLVQAMEQGLPIVFDEINAIPADILKRLNVILQLRPGDPYKIQEDNGREIIVAPGFCVIGTMNEKSHRYKGVDSLSVEFRARFITQPIGYPDQEVLPGGDSTPADLLKIAMLCCTDPIDGNVKIKNMTAQELVSFVRVAHFAQAMFTQPANDARFNDYVSSESLAESGQTALHETTISPREMVRMIITAQSAKVDPITLKPTTTLQRELAEFIRSIPNESDKKILQQLVDNYGLGLTEEETESPVDYSDLGVEA